MRFVRPFGALALACAAVVTQPVTTVAAPAPFEGLPVSCPGIGSTVLTAPGNGPFTPGFIEGTNELLLPYVVDVTVTSATGSTSETVAKSAPLPDGSVTCTFDVTFHIGGATYTIAGSVTGIVVGQP